MFISIMELIYHEVIDAYERIQDYVRRTPLEYSPYLSELCEADVYLKYESEQKTGSFKVRGAFNFFLSAPDKCRNGVVAASTGNHALAVAHVCRELNMRGTVYVPENASEVKLNALKHYPVEIIRYGDDCMVAEVYAREVSEKKGLPFISPYNDLKVVAGQGTVGYELNDQLNHIDHVLVSVGGGGLISGVAGYLKYLNKNVIITGCLPENSPVMYESVRAGKIIEMQCSATLSDGTAGGIEQGAVTFDLCRELVDDYILLNEEEIKEAVLLMIEHHHKIIEGAAGVAIASVIKEKEKYRNKNVVIVLCGANISTADIRQVLSS